MIGECDGARKYATPADLVREKRRQEGFEDVGLVVVRWGWQEAWHPRQLAPRLQRAFARGRPELVDPGVRFVRTGAPRHAA